MKEQILEAIKNDMLYDFIANNYWQIERDTLKDIILELYFLVIENTNTEERTKFNNKLIEYLKDNKLGWEEE